MQIGQIFVNKKRNIKYQVSYMSDCLKWGGAWILERIVSYHQVGHPYPVYAMSEDEFIARFSELKQVNDAAS